MSETANNPASSNPVYDISPYPEQSLQFGLVGCVCVNAAQSQNTTKLP